jgi:predicted nucleic acid-binding protein
MDAYVLDSSALIRYLDREAGADRVIAIFRAVSMNHAEILISAIQWGEFAGNLRKRKGRTAQREILESVLQLGCRVVSATPKRAVHAAEIKVDRKIAFADAFAVELTLDSPDYVLVTADFDFKAVEDLIQIEFLPVK